MHEKINKQDAFSEINQNIRILNQRIIGIEKANHSFESKIEQMEKDAKYSFHKDLANMNRLKNDMAEIKRKIKNTVFYLHHLINELKLTSKKEELKRVGKKIDNLDPYGFVTEKEARNIIKEVVGP